MINKIKNFLDENNIKYKDVLYDVKKTEFYTLHMVDSLSRFCKEAVFDTRYMFYADDPVLRQTVIINERSLLSEVVHPWAVDNNIVNVTELGIDTVGELKNVINKKAYREITAYYDETESISSAMDKDSALFISHKICSRYKISEIKRMGDQEYQDFYDRLKAYILALDVRSIQPYITKYYVKKLPLVQKEMLSLYCPKKIDNEVLYSIGMGSCSYTQFSIECVGIVPLGRRSYTIKPWLDLYQALVDGSTSVDVNNPMVEKRQRKELGDEFYELLISTLLDNAESIIIKL